MIVGDSRCRFTLITTHYECDDVVFLLFCAGKGDWDFGLVFFVITHFDFDIWIYIINSVIISGDHLVLGAPVVSNIISVVLY